MDSIPSFHVLMANQHCKIRTKEAQQMYLNRGPDPKESRASSIHWHTLDVCTGCYYSTNKAVMRLSDGKEHHRSSWQSVSPSASRVAFQGRGNMEKCRTGWGGQLKGKNGPARGRDSNRVATESWTAFRATGQIELVFLYPEKTSRGFPGPTRYSGGHFSTTITLGPGEA